jgi:hypothetical protein
MTVTINGTTGVAGVDGTAATPAIQGNDTNTGIFFPAADTIAFAEGGAEVARFNSSGWMGIGITNPNAELHVQGSPTTDGSIVFNQQLTATTAFNSSPQSGTMVSLKYNTGGDYAGLGGWSVIKENATDGNFAGAMLFHSRANGGAITERMRIDSSGNLLVGGTSALGKTTIYWDSSAQQGITTRTSSGTFNGSPIQFLNSSGVASGYISQAASSVSYVTSSDYRLKENIAPMTGALSKVALLKPCTYTWKVDGSDGQGFIAHELAEVCPDAVSGEKDAVNEDGSIKPQGIDTSFLVATLTAAIQEQQAIITDLKSRIEALEQA